MEVDSAMALPLQEQSVRKNRLDDSTAASQKQREQKYLKGSV